MNIYHRLNGIRPYTKQKQTKKKKNKNIINIVATHQDMDQYLEKPTLENYAAMMKNKSLKPRNIKRHKKLKKGMFYYKNNNIETDDDVYFCDICNCTFYNIINHHNQMKGKCPNTPKNDNNLSAIITKVIKDYTIKREFNTNTLAYTSIISNQPSTITYMSNTLYMNCPICMEMKKVAYIHETCGHCICQDCLLGLVKTNKRGGGRDDDVMIIPCGICRSRAERRIAIIHI